jgi:hypothetical protein
MNDLSEEINTLKEAIFENQKELIGELMGLLDIYEIEEELFQRMIKQLNYHTKKTFRLAKAIESQEIIDYVLTNKLK